MDSQGFSTGYSALHKAAMNNQADAIDALIEAGADIELMSNVNQAPLFLAACYTCSDSMLALLKRGAAVSTRTEHTERCRCTLFAVK